LYKIGIRYFYDEWGYYLTDACNGKFVGTVQIFEISKFHKYIHSFLDIVALCRAVAIADKINGEQKICIITNNLSDLFKKYTDYNDNPDWIMIIPLWIAALFEFDITGKLRNDIKSTLLMSVRKNNKADISIFLQSFWVDIKREELKNGILRYVQSFEANLYVK